MRDAIRSARVSHVAQLTHRRAAGCGSERAFVCMHFLCALLQRLRRLRQEQEQVLILRTHRVRRRPNLRAAMSASDFVRLLRNGCQPRGVYESLCGVRLRS